MIESITLKNFQSHKNTTINFCEGVNAIVGLSDSGKTAILRAINWVVNNKPTGEAFQSVWGGDTTVCLKLNNGIVVSRVRSSSTNYYMINDKEFKAFGREVPIEVQKVLNFGEVNIEKQMDVPFLLGISPGEVAQVLNKIVDLDNIDASISSIRKKKMGADRDLKTAEVNHESTCEELKQFDYLEAMTKEVELAENLEQIVTTTAKRKDELSQLLSSMSAIQQKIEKFALVIENEFHFNLVQESYDSLKLTYRQMTVLHVLLEQYEAMEKKTHIPIIDMEGDILYCIELEEKIRLQKQKEKDISVLLDGIYKNKNEQKRLGSAITTLTKKFTNLWPDACPLCGEKQ